MEYGKFADAVDEAFTTKGLELSPDKTPVPVPHCTHLPRSPRQFKPLGTLDFAASTRPTEVDVAGTKVVKQLARVVAAHRLLIQPTFKRFDKHHIGTGSHLCDDMWCDIAAQCPRRSSGGCWRI